MQGYAEGIRDAVWKKLEEIFKRYAGDKTYIQLSELERVVREVLGETSQAEIDYVMKNLFRLDSDNNGSIDFPELGNFLLKRHCGEMALQRMHMDNKMSLGAQRKMTLPEFTILMNNAYAFLGVKVADEGCKAIFEDADTDKDGIITYEEYFSFVQKHILRPKPADTAVIPVETGTEFSSLLRHFLWQQAKRVYDTYDKDHNQRLDSKELEDVFKAILSEYSDADVVYMVARSFKLNLTSEGFLKFNVFAPFFIICLAKLGLSKFSRHHPKKRTLTREEFILLFKRSFNILNAQRINDKLLSLFFVALDTNHDGLISYGQYMHWVISFLAVHKYFGSLRLLEDTPPDRLNMILPESILENNAVYVTRFHFSNLDLARRARLRTLALINDFDANKNNNLEEDEIVHILRKLMKSSDFDIFYVVANVFRYDVNNDGFITYDEMADFFLEMHNGELALQRLHKIHKFVRGDERLMNFDEFSKTLKDGLAYIDVVPTEQELKTLFSEIDLEKSGWISYKTYFEFLIAYFGTKSWVRYELDQKSKAEKTIANIKLSPVERLGELILKSLRELLKHYNPFAGMDGDKIVKFLMDIFKLSHNEAEYVLQNIMNREIIAGIMNEMASAILFLEILFAEIALTRWHRARKFKRWMERLISQDEFIQLVNETCFWMNPIPPTDLLIEIFKLLDTDHDGFITYDQYINFVLLMFKLKSKRKWPFEITAEVLPTPAATKALSEDIWSDLRALYMHYVKGKYLQENELQLLVKEVLHETTKYELEYIFWNMFRYDPNGDRNIEFEEFAPFILSHAAEIALQRFHYDQVKGKNSLTKEQFKVVFREAYHFLKSLNKTDPVLDRIFDDLDTNKDSLVSYRDYMTWVAIHIARVIR